MAEDYTITAVVQRDDWTHSNPAYGKFRTFAVQFEQVGEKWIKWNRKFKGEEPPTPPKTGDEVYGTVTGDKFSLESKDGTPSKSTSTVSSSPKKEWKDNSNSIEAQSAVKSATQVYAGTGATFEEVEKMARQLHNLIAVLANGDTPEAPSGYDAFKSAGGQVKSEALAKGEELPPTDAYADVVIDEFDDEPIDLSQIPF